MTKQEAIEWIKSAKYIDTNNDEYDKDGNHEVERIYEKDGKLYCFYWQNDYLYNHYDHKSQRFILKFIKDCYEPQPVERKTRMVEQVYYEYLKHEETTEIPTSTQK